MLPTGPLLPAIYVTYVHAVYSYNENNLMYNFFELAVLEQTCPSNVQNCCSTFPTSHQSCSTSSQYYIV